RGFTLIEAVIATVIVAVMLAAALQTVAVSARTQGKSSDASRGAALAAGLMAQLYVDSGALPLFGHEVGEVTTNRSACNDVDDYNGWTESPPQNRDGTTISNYSGWTRSVVVA